MALHKALPLKSASLKKKMTTEVSLQLTTALTSLKETLGAKKFDKRVRKAAKLLTSGIKDPETTTPAVKQVPAKKASPRKTVKPAKKIAKAKQAKKH